MSVKQYYRNQMSFLMMLVCVVISIALYTINSSAEDTASGDAYNKLPREYVITYHLNGGTNQSNPALYHEGEVLGLTSPVREGYTFLGWYDNALFQGEAVTTITTSAGGLHFYAKWQRQTYKIHYQYSGGKAMGSNPKTFQYKGSTRILYPAGRKGYQFLGWYRGDTNKLLKSLGEGIRSDITLKAKFKKLKVKKAKKVSVKRNRNVLIMQAKTAKDVAGYEFQYWKKKGKKVTLTGDVTRYRLLKFSSTEDYSFRVRCFVYDSTGSKVYGAYSKVTLSKGVKPKKEKK